MPDARIADEVGGLSHQTIQGRSRDAMKTAVLEVLGRRVFRSRIRGTQGPLGLRAAGARGGERWGRRSRASGRPWGR